MNKAETVAGAVIVVLGALLLQQSLRLPYIADGVPGPGFLPLWISSGIMGSGFVLAVKGVRAHLAPTGEAVTWPEPSGWRRVGLVLGALAVSLLLLTWLGFVLTTALFMITVIFGLGVRSWRSLVSVPLISAVVLYLIFAVMLRVPLPKGLLAFFE